MKRLLIFGLAVLMVSAMTLPVSALEAQFGGYWRTRAYTNQNFSGDDCEDQDLTAADTRTRLYFTAVLNDNLKFVNKFEMDATFGDTGYGDIGADGVKVEVKNSYADFNVGPVNAKVGVQGATLARGFLFSDDFAGAVVSYADENSGITLPFIWVKAYEGGKAENKQDFDYYAVSPIINAKGVKFNPFILYATSENSEAYTPDYHGMVDGFETVDLYYGGVNVDANLGPASVWLTGIYQGGEVETADAGISADISAWLAAAGGSMDLSNMAGMGADVHGQMFYATGQDPDDEDVTQFLGPKGQSYYWSEIMGYGLIDKQVSNNACADGITNIMAANAGTTIKPMSKMAVSFDVWYAMLAEDITLSNGQEENELGIEVNVAVSYKLVDGLKLDVVGAYLFAGDATNGEAVINGNDENPFEIGSRLSLSF